MKNMSSVRKRRLKDQLYAKQDGKCWLCDKVMSIGPGFVNHPKMASFDHVIPRAKGGTNKVANLKLAHRDCNIRRGGKGE
jgi:5-methylcytosine-specific restriction endonuclease McrA